MHALVAQHYEQIAALCRHYGVQRLAVFGSALREDFDSATSDLDVVAEFDSRLPGGALRRYFDFKHALESLMRRPVDIVDLEAMENTRLKRIIERTQVPVYAAAA